MWITNEMILGKIPSYLTTFLLENESRFQELILQATIHIRSKTGIAVPTNEETSPFWYTDTVAQLVHIFTLIQSGAISSEEQTMLIMRRWDVIDERLRQFRSSEPSAGKIAKSGTFPSSNVGEV
jgi:hypothetical protein